MAWLMIVVSLNVIWLASLCKILLASWSSSKATFLTSSGEASCKKNVLLVIAHPDDESMFFTPTINYLTSIGHNIHILCMSTGNADGIGNIRKEELYQASVILKVPQHQVKVLDHPNFQDGFGRVWDCDLLAEIVSEEINANSIDTIITFDRYGVSGHCNHRDLNRGVRSRLLRSALQREIDAWELVSTNLWRKYSGPIDIWLSILNAIKGSDKLHCLLNAQPRRSYVAMAQHLSQWVWFRKLFVSFSSYTFVNTLQKIEEGF
ncbi:N-acetylglucosaminylphosphatidylinositol deacetylase [Heracleum sosnowskyi]|uniref:N-acetylglucosaminylphosphatidylinositol deacetylase n=1 Tax=Heracleum sosnowskyi TaxID=360622 RepID=A0AAD8GPI8_9APIA|nr:N-acetylglucosaminylphosphatidylinositol deacetylase [Heracleum sosnowskyi]